VWSKPLARLLGHEVPLESQRGRWPRAFALPARSSLQGSTRVEALLRLIREVIPGVNTDEYSEWMGHRPALPDSLPVIGRSPVVPNAFFAFGHGFFGLIGAATTGQIIADLVTGRGSPIDLTPYRINRF